MTSRAFIILACATCWAGETNYLTRLQPIALQTPCPDFRQFKVEVWHPGATTNFLTFFKTDRLLTIHDVKGVSNGPVVLVVTALCLDGDESAPLAVDVVVRHERPNAPTLKPTPVTEEEASSQSFEELRNSRRRSMNRHFPPPDPGGTKPDFGYPAEPSELPGATNLVYRSERADLRRSQ